MRRFAILVLALSIFALPVAGAEGSTFAVSTTADSNSGTCTPGACTLRQAVEAANASSGADEVSLPNGEYSLTFGQLPIGDDLTVVGGGAGSVAIVSDGSSRVIANPSAAYSLTIRGVRISGGRVKGTSASQAAGGGIYNVGDLRLEGVVVSGNAVEPIDISGTSPQGGGIYNSGSLVIVDSTIEENVATARPFNGGIPAGGGVFNAGRVEIAESRFLDNEALTATGGIPEGAGLYSEGTSLQQSSATVVRSLFEGNAAIGEGGTIPSGGAIGAGEGDLSVLASTIRDNEAIAGTGGISEGGGLYVWSGGFQLAESLVANNSSKSATVADAGGIVILGTADDVQTIVNSTIVDNEVTAPTSASGGGLLHSSSAEGKLEVLNSTIVGNSSTGTGGNVVDFSAGGKGATVLRNSIVAAGSATGKGANCEGPVESAGRNIDSRDECNFKAAGDRVNADPLLGPLADNGGPTQTLALRAGSPALDAAGEPCPATDQRGVPRPQGPACDIGAFEVQVPAPPGPPSGRARLRFLNKRVAIAPKTGKGRLRVRCLNLAGDLCSVRLRLLAVPARSRKAAASKRRTKIGAVTGTVGGGKTGALRVKVNKRGRALLAANPNSKLRVRAAGKSRNRASEPVSVKTRLLLKLKGKRPPR